MTEIQRSLIVLFAILSLLLSSCAKPEFDSLQDPFNSEYQTLLLLLATGRSQENQEENVDDSNIPAEQLNAVVHVDAADWGMNYDITVLRCSIGQDLVDPNCNGTASGIIFCTTSNNSCNPPDPDTPVSLGPLFDACHSLNQENDGAGFAGISSWRVPRCEDAGPDPPNIDFSNCELKQLHLFGVSIAGGPNWADPGSEPATTLFPNTVGGAYWSASPADATTGWGVNFLAGTIFSSGKAASSYHVRCVAD